MAPRVVQFYSSNTLGLMLSASKKPSPRWDWASNRDIGEGGIRTHGGSHLNGFRDRPDRPLRHLSMVQRLLF
jgi:hypothetical protein